MKVLQKKLLILIVSSTLIAAMVVMAIALLKEYVRTFMRFLQRKKRLKIIVF